MRPCEAGSASANGLCTGQDQLPPLKKSQDELVPQKSCGAAHAKIMRPCFVLIFFFGQGTSLSCEAVSARTLSQKKSVSTHGLCACKNYETLLCAEMFLGQGTSLSCEAGSARTLRTKKFS